MDTQGIKVGIRMYGAMIRWTGDRSRAVQGIVFTSLMVLWISGKMIPKEAA